MVSEIVPPDERARFWSTPESVARMARSIYAQRAVARDALQEGVDKASEDAVAYMNLYRERALTELLMQQRVRAKSTGKMLDDLARTEYKATPERFSKPEQIHARHILLAVAKDGSDDAKVKAQAQELIDQIRKGADFAKLATEQSADKGSAARGGDLGFFARGRMAPDFERAAFALQKKGDLSAPVKTEFGYHVIELLERKPASTQPLEEALPVLREELREKINTKERTNIWKAAESTGKIDDDAVARLVKAKGTKE